MKGIFAVFALCLVSVNAGVIGQPNYEIMVDDVLKEMNQIAKEAAVTLRHSLDEIVLDPLNQVEEAVDSIEARRQEDESCVAAEDDKVSAVVDAMNKDMAECGVVAAKTSADIMTDISAATQQLVFGGYDVVTTYRRCKRYNNAFLQSSCYARLTIKATLYLANARKSIKTIRESTNERIPAVYTDADVCTHSAADTATLKLINIQESIDSCISKY